jgi:hypothetical protein
VSAVMINEPTVSVLPIERIEELARFGHEFYNEGQLPGKFVPEVFCKTWRNIYASNFGTLLVLQSGNTIHGALGAIVFPDPNDGEFVATEMFWYVRQEHRGKGMSLYHGFEQWAREVGARRMVMVHLKDLMPEVLAKIYVRMGYKATETHYVKEI